MQMNRSSCSRAWHLTLASATATSILTTYKDARLPYRSTPCVKPCYGHRIPGYHHTEDLHWHKPINSPSRTLGFLWRNLWYSQRELKQFAYFSLVRSWLKYASIAWNLYTVTNIEALEKIHRRGARFCWGNYKRDTSISRMLEELGWETLQVRHPNQRIHMMWWIVSSMVAIKSWRSPHHS